IGRAAILDTTGIEVLYKTFRYPGYTTGSVYVSLMINVKNANPAGGYFAGISPVQSANSRGHVYIKDSSERIALGIAKGFESPLYTPAIYSKNVTYLIVLKYTFIAGSSNDSVGLFVFDNTLPGTEPIPNLKTASNSSPDLNNVGSVSIYQSITNSPRVVIDGIYFRNSWDDQVLPVEIISFNANVYKRDVILNWATSSESNNSGFEIEKRVAGNLENVWMRSGFVKGNGTTALPQYYSITDKGLNTGRYQYRLKQIDYNGNFEYYNLENEVEIGIPDEYYISQNYPNPFNPSTKIDFDLPEEGFVNIKIYDINGREIKTILNEFKAGGYHTIEFNLGEVTSGIYFYEMIVSLNNETFVEKRKMILLK
ncbi:MAG: T9SS type A sorting domain-containing protein, partial [Bacteroidetes bacterium]|nr:T9SS type A sorting domain-containing protein [Bacteroidota bacterium]